MKFGQMTFWESDVRLNDDSAEKRFEIMSFGFIKFYFKSVDKVERSSPDFIHSKPPSFDRKKIRKLLKKLQYV